MSNSKMRRLWLFQHLNRWSNFMLVIEIINDNFVQFTTSDT
jgi:hypothetical protein